MSNKIGVIIGRFQGGPHLGHASLFEEAFAENDHVVVLVGSANSFRTYDNPFTFQERSNIVSEYCKNLIREGNRNFQTFSVEALDDYKYNDARWFSQVYSLVDKSITDVMSKSEAKEINIYGYYKDNDSFWLDKFPSWNLIPVVPNPADREIHASDIRRDYFLKQHIPSNVILEARQFLQDFTKTIEYTNMVQEYEYWQRELRKFDGYPYPGHIHAVCADSLVICSGHVLLIKRKFTPGKGAWALPGGHKEDTETFKDAAIRELREEVKLKVPEPVLYGSIKGEKLFDKCRRAGPINKPTLVQHIEIMPDNNGKLPKIAGAASDALEAKWVPLYQLNTDYYGLLHDDHKCIINYFIGI